MIVINKCWLSSVSVDCHQWVLIVTKKYWFDITPGVVPTVPKNSTLSAGDVSEYRNCDMTGISATQIKESDDAGGLAMRTREGLDWEDVMQRLLLLILQLLLIYHLVNTYLILLGDQELLNKLDTCSKIYWVFPKITWVFSKHSWVFS